MPIDNIDGITVEITEVLRACLQPGQDDLDEICATLSLALSAEAFQGNCQGVLWTVIVCAPSADDDAVLVKTVIDGEPETLTIKLSELTD